MLLQGLHTHDFHCSADCTQITTHQLIMIHLRMHQFHVSTPLLTTIDKSSSSMIQVVLLSSMPDAHATKMYSRFLADTRQSHNNCQPCLQRICLRLKAPGCQRECMHTCAAEHTTLILTIAAYTRTIAATTVALDSLRLFYRRGPGFTSAAMQL